jgi:DNA-binding NarL/FixJ family response regulator
VQHAGLGGLGSPYSEAHDGARGVRRRQLPVREGVAGLLTESPDIDLVETVADPAALHKAVVLHRPDAVLTDIRMPPTFTTEGIDAAKRIRSEFPDIGVVVLSQYIEEEYALELLSDGVEGLGYLLKERVTQADDLVNALDAVSRGGSVLDPKVVEGLLARKSNQSTSPLLGLTDREFAVLQQLATGRSNAATAKALYLSERAVENHVGSVFQKLGAGAGVRREPARDGGAGIPRGRRRAGRRPLRVDSTPKVCGQPSAERTAATGGCSWEVSGGRRTCPDS